MSREDGAQDPLAKLRQRAEHPPPQDVPVFNCIVHLSRDEQGRVTARVANLAGMACTSASERDALGKVVTMFKQQVAQWTQEQAEIPWVEPPPPAADVVTRLIPVHL